MKKLSEQAKMLESIIKSGVTDENSHQGKINLAITGLLKDIIQRLENTQSKEDFCCPSCGESVCIEIDMLETQEVIVCPKCKEPLNVVTQEF